MIFTEVLFNPAADVILGNDEFEQVRPRQVFPEVLRTCHQYYHEGRDLLYLNKMTFVREGWELLRVAKPLGVLSCCTRRCHRYGELPMLRCVRFLLGDNSNCIEGNFYTRMFWHTLNEVSKRIGINGRIKIGFLIIDMAMHCWGAKNTPFLFCTALQKIDLRRELRFTGIGYFHQALTEDPGNMEATLCAGKPQIRVSKPIVDLVEFLNWFAGAPALLTSENVEDWPLTIRKNMTTMTVNAAGNGVIVPDNYFVRYYSAYYRNGRLHAMAQVLDRPPLVLMVTRVLRERVCPAGGQNQQMAATDSDGRDQVLQYIAYPAIAQ